jgi:multiple sugar transport system substrate-binding protein
MGPLRAAAETWKASHGTEIRWDVRSLGDFGDEPIERLTARYDLLVIDHPFVGTANRTRCLAPLDSLLPPSELQALEADAIGPSHTSYRYAGHQWALATDAACQVSAVRDDLLTGRFAPASWDEVMDLANDLKGRVALPLAPADAMCSFLSICAGSGQPAATGPENLVDRDVGQRAIEILARLVELGHPDCMELKPPAALERMTGTDEIVYVPLTFGYTNYSRPGVTAHPCRFLDAPSSGLRRAGSILGGAGLAVSATSMHLPEAAEFAGWLASATVQKSVVFPAGGQPGSRSVWLDLDADRAAGGFMSGTRATIESAWVRPRETWWPPFQLAAGDALHHALERRVSAEETLIELERLYEGARRES